MYDTLLVCLTSVVAYLIYRALTSTNTRYPPGPRSYPFIGNIPDVPTSYQERAFADLAKIYGMSSDWTQRSLTHKTRGCDPLAYLQKESHYPIVLQGRSRVT